MVILVSVPKALSPTPSELVMLTLKEMSRNMVAIDFQKVTVQSL